MSNIFYYKKLYIYARINFLNYKFKGKFFKRGKNKNYFIDGALNKLIIIIILFAIGIFIETYISPSLIKFVAKKFYL